MAKKKNKKAGYKKNKAKQTQKSVEYKASQDIPTDSIAISNKFATLNKLITRDLNNNIKTPTFSKYTKDEISTYIANPYQYEAQLRNAVIYMYGASSHFRRIIQYFVGLTDWAYIVEPYKINPQTANVRITGNNYRKVLNTLSSFSIKTQFSKILTVCLREDVFYGTLIEGKDTIMIQQLPSDYCSISSIEENVMNVTFDFSYFDAYSALLEYYPAEFTTKYNQYKSNRQMRWIELDSPTSFAVKCNKDILDYAMPPFAGILRNLFDLEDYIDLKSTKTALENYALLAMKLPMQDDGTWGIDLDKA